MAKMFTDPDDYVLSRVNAYPCLYASDSFENTKLLVLDQLLNVIGNGVRDAHELRRELRWHEFDRERGLRLCSGEPVAWGYMRLKTGAMGFSWGVGRVSLRCSASVTYTLRWCIGWSPNPFISTPTPIFRKNTPLSGRVTF